MKDKDTYSRYGKTRIISARALQIAQGSPVLVKVSRGVINPTEIARLEWEAGVIPIDIKQKDENSLNHAAKSEGKNKKK